MIGFDYDNVINQWFASEDWETMNRVTRAIYNRCLCSPDCFDPTIWIISNREGVFLESAKQDLEEHLKVPFGLHGAFHKVPACRELGITVFVDDQINNIRELTQAGVLTLIFNQPWNFGYNPELSIRVYSWKHFETILPYLMVG